MTDLFTNPHRYGDLDAGEAQTAKTTFVGGHKTVPIRYTLKGR